MNNLEQGVNTDSSRTFYAFFVTLVAAVGGFLFGYDLVIISGAQIFLREQFHLEGFAFGFATSSAILGCIAGPFLGAWLCDAIGRRQTLIFSAVLFGVSAIFTAIPKDMVTFNIFRIVGGIGVGLCSIASPMYIAEIAPARMRGRMGIMYQVAIGAGALLSGIVAWALALNQDPSTTNCWRWMFGSEMVPIIGFVALLLCVPRSPRWLAEKGRFDEAQAVLNKIQGPEIAQKEITAIKEDLDEVQGTFADVFAPGLRMALFVGIGLAILNQWTGWTAVSYYTPTLFQKGGFSEASDAIGQFIILTVFETGVTLAAIFIVDRFGRKPLWLIGSLWMIISLFLAGLIFHFNIEGFFVLVVLFGISAPHGLALGPLPWLMMSELYPTRIRAKAVAITTTIIWIAGWSAPFLFPIFCEKSEELIGSVAGAIWFFIIICVASIIFGLKWLPETKGRTLEEIAESWTKK